MSSVTTDLMGIALLAMGCINIYPWGERPAFIVSERGPGDFGTREEVVNAWLLYGQGKRETSPLPSSTRR